MSPPKVKKEKAVLHYAHRCLSRNYGPVAPRCQHAKFLGIRPRNLHENRRLVRFLELDVPPCEIYLSNESLPAPRRKFFLTNSKQNRYHTANSSSGCHCKRGPTSPRATLVDGTLVPFVDVSIGPCFSPQSRYLGRPECFREAGKMKDIRIGLLISIGLHLCLIGALSFLASRMDGSLLRVIPIDLRFLSDGIETAGEIRAGRAPERHMSNLRGFSRTSQPGARDLQRPLLSGGGAYLDSERRLESPSPKGQSFPGKVAGSEREISAAGIETTFASTMPIDEGSRDRLGTGAGPNGIESRSQGPVARREGSHFGGIPEGGRDFSAIRNAVVKNVHYPERARRMGLEGKVTISFVVLEDGSTAQIRVVQGSGFGVLDEEAKRAVARTRIIARVPYGSLVLLPVQYSLSQN
jgi:TonB family protein